MEVVDVMMEPLGSSKLHVCRRQVMILKATDPICAHQLLYAYAAIKESRTHYTFFFFFFFF